LNQRLFTPNLDWTAQEVGHVIAKTTDGRTVVSIDRAARFIALQRHAPADRLRRWTSVLRGSIRRRPVPALLIARWPIPHWPVSTSIIAVRSIAIGGLATRPFRTGAIVIRAILLTATLPLAASQFLGLLIAGLTTGRRV
jgi:hypothetical protein